MQESIQTTTMPPPQNPTGSTQETESNKTARYPEPDHPVSSQNPPESKNSKPNDVESAPKSDETAATELNKRRGVKEEEEGVRAPTAPTKSEGTVEDSSSSSSGRERLKRHRVEVAGRVWIPDMWGQEDLMKDWIDCTAFDASLVNSSIVLARDSLMGEGRRASSTRLRIQNGC